MSRIEVNTIQSKLKTAIQSHQMLLMKMKCDSQNTTMKKTLADLQEEIKRLSEEQKKIVVKLRENLIKSTNQPQPLPAHIGSMGQTITAIGQPRLVSFPTQGGAAILPVGMVALPIAHMQSPGMGMTLHPAGSISLSQPTNLSVLPGNIISSGCGGAINLSTINTGGVFALGAQATVNNPGVSILPNHNSITINNSQTAAGLGENGLGGKIITNPVAALSTACSNSSNVSSVTTTASSTCTAMSSANSTLTSSSLISLTNLLNSSALCLNNNNIGTNRTNGNVAVTAQSTTQAGNSSQLNNSTSTVSHPILTFSTNTTPITSNMPVSNANVIVSSISHQPLVQPHLLQQQQQQILQMIQQQQQQPPQQRLASHLPIKVPQYSASHMKPSVNATTVQYCNIAPAPNTGSSQNSKPVTSVSCVPTHCTMTKPVLHKDLPPQSSVIGKEAKEKTLQQPAKQESLKQQKQQASEKQKQMAQIARQAEKVKFMKAIGLYSPEAIKDLQYKRFERKRRSTANPQYSIGFEVSRRYRTEVWNPLPAKKPKVTKSVSKVNQHSNSAPPQTNTVTVAQNISKMKDNHDDYCAVCSKGGQLLMCETCKLVYHLDCLNPPLTEAPKYAWSCPKCLVSGKGITHLNSDAMKHVHSYIAKRASKEDEKKRLQKKHKDMMKEKLALEVKAKELEDKSKNTPVRVERLKVEEAKVKSEMEKICDFVKSFKDISSRQQPLCSLSS